MPRGTRPLLVTSLCLILVNVLAFQASADKKTAQGTIELKSGDRFEDVQFEIDDQFHVIRIQLQAGPKTVSFSSVAKIEQDGQDRTEEFLGRRGQPVISEEATSDTTAGEPARETWVSKHDEEYRAAVKPVWHAMVEAHAGYGVPVGDYYEGVKAGANVGGDLLVAVTHRFAFRGSFTRLGWGDDFGQLLDPSIAVDPRITGLRFLGAGQYCHRLDDSGTDPSMAYLYVGLGAIAHRLSVNVVITDPSGTLRGEETDTQTKFITSLGGGVLKTIHPRFGFDFTANLDLVYVGRTTGEFNVYADVQYAAVLDFRVGVVAIF